MSSERAPFAVLDDILRRTQHLLIDFDGPVCSLFAGTPTAPIAERPRAVIIRKDLPLTAAIEHTTGWFEILTYAASLGPGVAANVES
jgi:hypothetical protein